MVAGVELNYNTSATALQMAQAIMGDGITVLEAFYTGDPNASAIYSGGDTISPGVLPGDSGVILSTGRARSFTSTNSSQSNLSNSTTSPNSGPNNVSDFVDVAGASTFDASFLDIRFVPEDGVSLLSIKFVFASDEFPEFSNSIYNDVVGIWVNDQLVPVSAGDGTISVGNTNQVDSENIFVSNTGDQFNTEMDGFTLTLSLDIPVNANEENTIRIGISDVADANYDSNLLIAADSIQGTLVAIDDTETIGIGGTRTFDPLANDIAGSGVTLTITHINGIQVSATDTVTLTTGQEVTLNSDGTLTVTTDTDVEDINFTYTISDGAGSDDIALVTIETVPCFAAGTKILTSKGEVAVETLRAGDRVVTLDDGVRPVIWVGSRQVTGVGQFAPIRVAKGALGNYRTLFVSPQHRIVVSDPRAELLFGTRDVLVAAKHLVNGSSIRAVPMESVLYVHLLFDRHQIICAEGILTESLLPGEMALLGYGDELRMDIENVFTQNGGEGSNIGGAAARRILKAHEASALLGYELAV